MSPKNDERVELRVSAVDVKYWREAAEQADMTLSDWIRRACFNALPDDLQMMIYRHDQAERRGATLHTLTPDSSGRVDGGRFHVERSRKPGKTGR